MNPAIEKKLETLSDELHQALSSCAGGMAPACTSLDESIESMTAIIDVISIQHQSAVWALIGSILDLEHGDVGFSVKHSSLKDTVHKCIETFSDELIENITESCKDAGYGNIFDPNAKVREEIINGDV